MLKMGEYDVWAIEMEAHVMSIDAQCQKIIKGGDEKITVLVDGKEEGNPLSTYKKDDFKHEEKNFKALKFVMSGLGQTDKRKMFSSKNAKEKWDALEKIYQGSDDVKHDRIVTLLQDYDCIFFLEDYCNCNCNCCA